MGVEYERKYRATPESLEQLKKAFSQSQTVISMETTYYDTPGGDFSARHWTVRRRMENEKSVCTFKFPVDGMGRGEFEVESPCLEDAVKELCKLSVKDDLATLAKAGLVPVCGARFTRTAVDMTVGNTHIELALDQGVLLGGGRQIPLCEVEAELKAGDPKDVDRFGAYLQTAFGLEPEKLSKFARAKMLAKGEL